MRYTSLSIVLAALLLLPSCSEGPTSSKYVPLPMTITGVVTDSETQAGIGDVLMQANEFGFISHEPATLAETRTNNEGRYTLKFEVDKSTCREDKYSLWALKDFYETGPHSGTIKCARQVQVINVQLIPLQ